MDKYIRITNTAGEVSRLSLEKLGLSTKRNNPDTIGKFGSGIKFAPIAALRNGWEWYFTGTDNNGPFILEYIIKQEEGIDCIWYKYEDYEKPSSFTIDAGTLSWTDAFQIYREAVSNAIDGASENEGDWFISLVDEVHNVDGEFTVYISASPELMKIYYEHDLYFSNKRDVLFSMFGGKRKALSKIDNKTRVYCHNVLIYENSEFNSIFDYCLDDIELNEERTIKSEWTLNHNIETLFCTADRSIIKTIISAATSSHKYYEFENSNGFSYTSGFHFDPFWLECFRDMYGHNAVILDSSTSELNIDSALKMRNMKPILIESNSAYRLLKSAGIPTAIDKMGEQVKYEIDDCLGDYPKLLEAISIARIAEPKLEMFIPTLSVFKSAEDQVLGLTIDMNKNTENRRILIEKTHALKSSIPEIISTLIHECDHAVSGLPDSIDSNGRLFRETADQRIGQLIYEFYRPNPFFIEDGVVCFSVSEVSDVGSDLIMKSEYSVLLDCLMVKIGNFVLKAEGQELTQEFSTHQPIFIHDATVLSYPTLTGVENLEVIQCH